MEQEELGVVVSVVDTPDTGADQISFELVSTRPLSFVAVPLWIIFRICSQ